MKAIMIMFDSLNRRMLSPYGCNNVITPNFERLAGRSLQFDNCYAGSLPCMPARREIHTGRYNFLHRGWSPLEPFDDSMPELLKRAGIYTHMITDHYHYWEDGGATYHNRYSSWEFVRGQEADLWKAAIKEPNYPPNYDKSRSGRRFEAERRNFSSRNHMVREEDMSLVKTFQLGMDFLEENYDSDNWFLQLECFDPHEPFAAAQRFRDMYAHEYSGPHFDWPYYGPVTEDAGMIEHCHNEAKALYTMCDEYLGRILDLMDEKKLWDDTMLIVNTDHGFLMGEHNWWAKNISPCYDEIAHIPLFIWDPRYKKAGERRESLVGTIDIAPTLLDYFEVSHIPHMNGRNLRATIDRDEKVHDGVLFGYFGQEVNLTDGRYVYMRGSRSGQTIHEYTLMPCYFNYRMSPELLATASGSKENFSFLKNCPVIKIPQKTGGIEETRLYDLKMDSEQENPLRDKKTEERLQKLMIRLMHENEAPPEQFERLGLEQPLKN